MSYRESVHDSIAKINVIAYYDRVMIYNKRYAVTIQVRKWWQFWKPRFLLSLNATGKGVE